MLICDITGGIFYFYFDLAFGNNLVRFAACSVNIAVLCFFLLDVTILSIFRVMHPKITKNHIARLMWIGGGILAVNSILAWINEFGYITKLYDIFFYQGLSAGACALMVTQVSNNRL